MPRAQPPESGRVERRGGDSGGPVHGLRPDHSGSSPRRGRTPGTDAFGRGSIADPNRLDSSTLRSLSSAMATRIPGSPSCWSKGTGGRSRSSTPAHRRSAAAIERHRAARVFVARPMGWHDDDSADPLDSGPLLPCGHRLQRPAGSLSRARFHRSKKPRRRSWRLRSASNRSSNTGVAASRIARSRRSRASFRATS